MKKKVIKYTTICFFSIVLLYLSFMTGRYSWLIAKPSFLFNSRDAFYVQEAREHLLEDEVLEQRLQNPRLQNAVIVHFYNNEGNKTIEVVLEKTSGQILQSTDYLN